MRTLLALIVLLAAGCSDPAVVASSTRPADGSELPAVGAPTAGGTADPSPDEAGDEDDGAAPEPRPETTELTLVVEGEPHEWPMRLMDLSSFPVPFSSYVPDDASVELPGSGDAAVVEWKAASITLGVALGETPEAALARIRAAVPEGIEPSPVESDWASGAFWFAEATQGPSYVNSVYVGQHDGTTFVVETVYPDEMGDGWVPVEDAFFDQWRWADGSSLR